MLWCAAAAAQDGASTRELVKLPPRAANRTVQKDLLSVLEPVREIRSGMLRQLHGVYLVTKAYGTEFEGVCRRDELSLRYAPTEQDSALEDAPVRPYGIEATPSFHIIKLPTREPGDDDRQSHVWQPQCVAAGHDDKANWFGAPDAHAAVQGALVLEAALKAIRLGTLKAQPCPSVYEPKGATCEAAILEIGDLSRLDTIEICPAEADTLCYAISLNVSTKLTIKAQAEGEALAPGPVTSIAIEQFIIVT
jgi:hypothetical protein